MVTLVRLTPYTVFILAGHLAGMAIGLVIMAWAIKRLARFLKGDWWV